MSNMMGPQMTFVSLPAAFQSMGCNISKGGAVRLPEKAKHLQ